MLDYKLKIALAPVRRWLHGRRTGIFNPDYAVKNKKMVLEYIRRNFASNSVEFVDLEFLNDEGLMYDISQAEEIAKYFNAEGVDGLVIINCNFGCEEVAGKVAKILNKPTLIWAPQDTIFDEDGMRYTDSQCGLFAISKQLQRIGIPFSHIENSKVEDEVFNKGFEEFLSVACMIKNFRKLRIAQIGSRPKPFNSVIFNEGELLEKFGIEVIPINLAILIQEYNSIFNAKSKELNEDVKKVKAIYDVGALTDLELKKMMTFKYLYKKISEDNNCQIISTECWTAMLAAVGAMPCLAMSVLADDKLIVTCESDVLGAITMALLSCAARGKTVPFFGEFTVRHPENKNAELLWHCGPFAYSLKKPGERAVIFNLKPGFRLKDGNYTIARLDSLKGEYSLLGGTFKTTDGPHTFGTYLWAEFDDYVKWEKKLINGPYIHHMAEIEGDYRGALQEFCKYIPGLHFDTP